MQLDAEVFMALLRRLLPRVHKHLQQVGVGPLLYLPEWFLCLFARSLPFPTVLRVWDAFLSEGKWQLPGGQRDGVGALGCWGTQGMSQTALFCPTHHCQSWPWVWVLGGAKGDSTLPALGKQPPAPGHTLTV